MIEQDAVGRVNAVRLAVVHGDPIGVKLGCGVRTARLEGGGLVLRRFARVAVQFGGRRLIEAHAFIQFEDSDRFEQSERSQRVGVGRVFGRLEAHLDMALGGKVIDLGRLSLLDEADQVGGVGEIAVVQMKAHVCFVGIAVKMINPLRVERG